jgi:UPF0176 protein
MPIVNIAGYKFTSLTNLPELRAALLDECLALNLKGTILLSHEGININIAAAPDKILLFKKFLHSTQHFSDMEFHETISDVQPFRFTEVKIKKEIITLRTADVHPELKRAPTISAQEFKQWLDEGRDITVLDTRNEYEVQFGTFKNAVNLHINDFSEFPQAAENLNHEKPIVMFCTGGIRCEKAALALLEKGFEKVYQLDKGILGYFKQVGGAHYEGECFVFDERVSVNPNLTVTGTKQCKICQKPMKDSVSHLCKG